ncbi:MAG: DEAD/DEAH box helicase [Nanoarchaeota archaeon]|nr:DEAD/DEAH box helicase [Nanoarchaeota archaeon]MBU1321482.1 DEAD/DEAH box helicase [Nanoarchaeota archaeon]MBU1597314.1 DEAD/DEAH box helicase [Nanoarchaeota archaeon]MBU2441447.1 DEAD/DEAH box helicase [Nanoarchaeota archaeon]
MNLSKYKEKIPEKIYALIEKRGFLELRPCQTKSINAGLFQDKNLLVCTPTASGKTLVAELAFLNAILHDKGKAVYVVPLRALASEKYKTFKRDYPNINTAISSGDIDSADSYLERYDLIITTSEKFDSLIRHKANWLRQVKTVVIDEIHLLNDPRRGPTLEVLITILRNKLKNMQLIGLSATIGNPEELAEWLDAKLVIDHWRPIRLDKGVYLDGEVEFK